MDTGVIQWGLGIVSIIFSVYLSYGLRIKERKNLEIDQSLQQLSKDFAILNERTMQQAEIERIVERAVNQTEHRIKSLEDKAKEFTKTAEDIKDGMGKNNVALAEILANQKTMFKQLDRLANEKSN